MADRTEGSAHARPRSPAFPTPATDEKTQAPEFARTCDPPRHRLSTAVTGDVVTMDKIVALCKRRGLIFPASEIYGGIADAYDYRRCGVLLQDDVVNAWWKAMIQERDDIVALDWAIIQHPRTSEASDHLAGCRDPLVQCLGECRRRFREDHLREERRGARARTRTAMVCPEGGGELAEAQAFRPHVRGPDRPGGGGGIQSTCVPRPPRASSSTSAPRSASPARSRRSGSHRSARCSGTRSRPGTHVPNAGTRAGGDGVFVPPAEAEQWHGRRMERRMERYVFARRGWDKLRLRPHGPDELSHYRSGASDIEYLYPIGWSELEGIANRGDFDLTQHAEHSGQKLEYVDTASGERYVPHVIEPAAGLGRTVLTLLCDAYDEDEIGGEQRTVLRLMPRWRRSRRRCCRW